MILFYIRHGDPIYSPDSLTELGKKQAAALAGRLAGCGIERLFSSDSNRAIMTATPTSEATGLGIELCPWANESLTWRDFTVDDGSGGVTWAFYNQKYLSAFCSREVIELGKKWYDHPFFAKNALQL